MNKWSQGLLLKKSTYCHWCSFEPKDKYSDPLTTFPIFNYWTSIMREGAFQVALVVKNQPANTEDIRDTGSIPGSGRPPGGGHGNPLQYSCLENPMDRGAWPATSTGSHRVRHNWNDLARMHALWGRHHRKNILSSLSDLYFCFSTRTQIHIFWLLSLSGKYYLTGRILTHLQIVLGHSCLLFSSQLSPPLWTWEAKFLAPGSPDST